jgi:hypothetical protein
MAEPAVLFRNRLYGDAWRVEWPDESGGVQPAIFSGPMHTNARSSMPIRQYGRFEDMDRPC